MKADDFINGWRKLREKWRRHRLVDRKQLAVMKAVVDAEVADLAARVGALDNRLNAIGDHFFALPSPATSASIATRIPIATASASEICLFVTFAPHTVLKRHVRDHVEELRKQGIAVVLIVNTTLASGDIEIETGLAALLSGCIIRANSGFDFAAWAHAYSLLFVTEKCRRLYLVNDSIVGPLQVDPYAKMIENIRASSADLVGLTENSRPQPHLQSYFLVANDRLLHSKIFDRLLSGVVNLPTKDAVIAQYETQITRYLRAQGFRCEAIYRKLPGEASHTDDTIYHWAELIAAGFPFVKASILANFAQSPEAKRLVPQKYLD